MKTSSLKFHRRIAAPLPEVYRAFVNAASLREWLCRSAEVDPRPGGQIHLWWNPTYFAVGEFLKVKPEERLVFSWHGRNDPGVSQVKISFQADEAGTQVTLEHADLGEGKVWRATRQAIRLGWLSGLENLQATLETGEDLRQRPAGLGLDVLAQVDEGWPILSFAPEYVPPAEGLQVGDVLRKVAGVKLETPDDLPRILGSYPSGEPVKVAFRRDGVKMTATIPLVRPQPDNLSATLAELVASFAEHATAVNAQLDKLLQVGAPTLLERRPDPASWNAREILAHLIAAERETQTWIAAQLAGQDAAFEPHSSQPARMAGILAIYPHLDALRAAYAQAQQETQAMLQALPPEVIAHKRLFWRLAAHLHAVPWHVQLHLDQLAANLNPALQLPEPDFSQPEGMIIPVPSEEADPPEVVIPPLDAPAASAGG